MTGRLDDLGQPDKHFMNIQNYPSLLNAFINGDPGTQTVELAQLYYFDDPAITRAIGKRYFAYVPLTFKLDKIVGSCYQHGSLVHVRVKKGAANHNCAWDGPVPNGYLREDALGNPHVPGIWCSIQCLPTDPDLAQDMDFIGDCG